MFGLLFSLPCSCHVHTRRILADEFLLQLFLQILQFHAHPVPALLDLFDLIQQAVHLFQRRLYLALQFFDFPPAPQKIAAVLKSAAADRTARHEEFSFKRHHSQAVAGLSREPHRIVHMVNHQDPAKQGRCHIPVPVFHPHQGIRKSQDTRFRKQFSLTEFLPVSDAGKGQKGRPASFYGFQIGDHLLCGLFCIGHNILNASAERRFDRRLIFLVHLQEIRNHPQDTWVRASLFHHPFHAAAVSFITFCQIGQRIQP